MRRRLVIVGVVAALAVGGWACGEDDPSGGADTGFARPGPVSSAATSPADDGSRGDGTFEVGVGIAPGKWSTKAPENGYGCFWSRKKDLSGAVGSIVDNGIVPKGAPGIIQIAASDKFIDFSGGCRWVLAA